MTYLIEPLELHARGEKGKDVVLRARSQSSLFAFHVYGRSIHPELFQICRTARIQRGGYLIQTDITSSGHVVTIRHGSLVLSEVSATSVQPLPTRRCLLSRQMRQNNQEGEFLYRDISYQVCFQLETLDPEQFWNFQEELRHDGERTGMMHRFDSGGRLALGALSTINVDIHRRRLFIQAFHTFPSDYSIAKSQTLIEFPG